MYSSPDPWAYLRRHMLTNLAPRRGILGRMNVLLLTTGYPQDPAMAAGVKLRSMTRWLVEAGHDVQVLGLATNSGVEATLRQQGVEFERIPGAKNYSKKGGVVRKVLSGPPLVGYVLDTVRVVLVLTPKPQPSDAGFILAMLEGLIEPMPRGSVVVVHGDHPAFVEARRAVHRRGLRTVTLQTVKPQVEPGLLLHDDPILPLLEEPTDADRPRVLAMLTPAGAASSA